MKGPDEGGGSAEHNSMPTLPPSMRHTLSEVPKIRTPEDALDATGEDAAPKTSAESFKAAEQTYIEKYRIDALERQRQRWQFEQRSWSSHGARRTYSDW